MVKASCPRSVNKKLAIDLLIHLREGLQLGVPVGVSTLERIKQNIEGLPGSHISTAIIMIDGLIAAVEANCSIAVQPVELSTIITFVNTP